MAASGQPLAAWDVIFGPLVSDRGQCRRPGEVVVRLPGLTKAAAIPRRVSGLEASAKASIAARRNSRYIVLLLVRGRATGTGRRGL
ncbi:hypothetical protein V492_04685 [Pseudogymnoascus sp. VKM F-4246]|nr:hypothetical protein V492_04685 [Pseudogymnoascus sp. VKM F-4246]